MADEVILGSEDSGDSSGDGAGEEIEGSTALTAEEGSSDDTGDEKKAAGDTTGTEEDGDTDKKSEDAKGDEDKDGAPTEYQDFTLPEGIEMDTDLLGKFAPILQGMKATQEQAQSFIDLHVEGLQNLVATQQADWKEVVDGWKTAAQTDEEFGKGKYDASLATARVAMREFGTPALFKALEDTGMGEHPEFIRIFHRVGKAIEEDSFSFGKTGEEGAPKTPAERIFPNQGKAA